MTTTVTPADVTYGDLPRNVRADIDALMKSAFALEAAARSGGLPYGPVIRDILGDVLEYGAALGVPMVATPSDHSPETR
jgi:hypothetical protein